MKTMAQVDPPEAQRPEGRGRLALETYKPGQGSRARRLALLLGLLVAFMGAVEMNEVQIDIGPAACEGLLLTVMDFPIRVRHAVDGLCFGGFGVAVWFILNRRRSAEYLIETDHEMDKVTWAPWAEVKSATWVVLVLLGFLAATMGLVDLFLFFLGSRTGFF